MQRQNRSAIEINHVPGEKLLTLSILSLQARTSTLCSHMCRVDPEKSWAISVPQPTFSLVRVFLRIWRGRLSRWNQRKYSSRHTARSIRSQNDRTDRRCFIEKQHRNHAPGSNVVQVAHTYSTSHSDVGRAKLCTRRPFPAWVICRSLAILIERRLRDAHTISTWYGLNEDQLQLAE